jgi:hypothetical protein
VFGPDCPGSSTCHNTTALQHRSLLSASLVGAASWYNKQLVLDVNPAPRYRRPAQTMHTSTTVRPKGDVSRVGRNTQASSVVPKCGVNAFHSTTWQSIETTPAPRQQP